jgi:hypothetical protein
MTPNPFLNALAATAYISGIVSLMNYGQKFFEPKDTILAPIAFLSLFVLSAATMSYIFFFQPFRKYFNGQKEEALSLFLKTIGFFALITACVFAALLTLF